MAVKKVGTLIREARTAKKFSQEQLASEIDGLSGSDIGKAERGEKDLSPFFPCPLSDPAFQRIVRRRPSFRKERKG